jgi:hypothetical protein
MEYFFLLLGLLIVNRDIYFLWRIINHVAQGTLRRSGPLKRLALEFHMFFHACAFEDRRHPDRSTLKRVFCPLHQMASRVHIQMRATNVLEHRDFIGMRTSRVPAGAQVKQIGENGRTRYQSSRYGLCDFTGALATGSCINKYVRSLYYLVIRFAHVGRVSPDQVDVSAWPKERATNQWRRGHRDARYDIRRSEGQLQVWLRLNAHADML